MTNLPKHFQFDQMYKDWCSNCIHEKSQDCEILTLAFVSGQIPKEWFNVVDGQGLDDYMCKEHNAC